MKSKTLLKVMAAIAIVCLPFLAASCSKDEPTGPETHEYSWEISGVDLNSNNYEQVQTWLTALTEVNKLVANAIREKGFTVNATEKTFTIEIERGLSITPYDEMVEDAILDMKKLTSFKQQAEKLPNGAKVIIKRGRETIVNRSLK